MINLEMAKLRTGVTLNSGQVVGDIIQSMFDGKIFSGSGASCQMCTAIHKYL